MAAVGAERGERSRSVGSYLAKCTALVHRLATILPRVKGMDHNTCVVAY